MLSTQQTAHANCPHWAGQEKHNLTAAAAAISDVQAWHNMQRTGLQATLTVVWYALQGPRYSMPYFVNPKLNYVIEGPQKRWGPVTGFDMLSKTGKAWQSKQATQVVSGSRACTSMALKRVSHV